jgi:hypothetical protein
MSVALDEAEVTEKRLVSRKVLQDFMVLWMIKGDFFHSHRSAVLISRSCPHSLTAPFAA